jgi:putative Mg2+ transporter-C (MgtC) family protein
MIGVGQTILRLLLAFLFGSIIGIERESKQGDAGLRTHILVCIGSTLIMLISLRLFEVYRLAGTVDPGRIAAGVVTGIGFIGAGTIMRSSERVRGLTTAASIWVSAAIGLAVGCGYFSAAFSTTILAYIALAVLKRYEEKKRKSS